MWTGRQRQERKRCTEAKRIEEREKDFVLNTDALVTKLTTPRLFIYLRRVCAEEKKNFYSAMMFVLCFVKALRLFQRSLMPDEEQ